MQGCNRLRVGESWVIKNMTHTWLKQKFNDSTLTQLSQKFTWMTRLWLTRVSHIFNDSWHNDSESVITLAEGTERKKSFGPAWRPGPGSPYLAARSRDFCLEARSRVPLPGGQVQGATAWRPGRSPCLVTISKGTLLDGQVQGAPDWRPGSEGLCSWY